MDRYITSIDVGHRNFCVAVEKYTYPFKTRKLEDILAGNLVFFHNSDFGVRKKGADDGPLLLAILDWLDVHKQHFDKCDTILIEQQLKTNPFAQKIEHVVYSWFLEKYRLEKSILSFPASNKTRVLNAPKKMSKPERKKWAVDKATEILCCRGDEVGLQIMKDNKKKADDLGDTLCMIQAWKILNP